MTRCLIAILVPRKNMKEPSTIRAQAKHEGNKEFKLLQTWTVVPLINWLTLGPIWHTLQQVEKYTDQLRYIVSISKDEGQKTSHKT